MAAIVSSLLYLGAIGAVGAGVYGMFVMGPHRQAGKERQRLPGALLLGAAAGTLLLLVAGPLDIYGTLSRLLGRVTPDLYWQYLGSTRHGMATLWRSGLALALLASLFLPLGKLTRALFALLATGLLATFSWTSHSAAMGGNVPLAGDLAHLLAASTWVGSVFYGAWTAPQPHAQEEAGWLGTVERISALGLLSVILLFGTGLYMGLLHLSGPPALLETDYGQAFMVKLGLVLTIVLIAAANRFWLVPALRRGKAQGTFRAFLRGESILLVLVVVATGVLTTSALPHGADQPTPLENLQNFLRWQYD